MDQQSIFYKAADLCSKVMDTSLCLEYMDFVSRKWEVLFCGIGVFIIWVVFTVLRALIFGSAVRERIIEKQEAKIKEDPDKDTADTRFLVSSSALRESGKLSRNDVSEYARYSAPKIEGKLDIVLLDSIRCSRAFSLNHNRFDIDERKQDRRLVYRGRNLRFLFFEENPRLLCWSPDGSLIMTTCGCDTSSIFQVNETKNDQSSGKAGIQLRKKRDYSEALSREAPSATPKFCFWTKHPFFGSSVLVKGSYYNDPTWFIFRNHGISKPLALASCKLGIGGLSAISEPKDMFNPWRPGGHETLLLCESSGNHGGARMLSLFDVNRALDKSDITKAILRRYDFDDELKPQVYIQSYAWSNSGDYIAITVGENRYDASQMVYVIAQESGRIVFVSDKNSRLVNWTPGDEGILLEHSIGEDWIQGHKRYSIAIPRTGEVHFLTDNELTVRWVEKLVQDNGDGNGFWMMESSYYSTLNATREFSLYQNEEWFSISHREESSVVEQVLVRQAHIRGKVQWSPVDPYRLAGVGEIDGEFRLRIWDLKF